MVLDIFDDVADGFEVFDVLVRNLGVEFFLQSHHQVNNIKGVSTQILDDLRLLGHLFFLQVELVAENLLYLFENVHSSPSFLFPVQGARSCQRPNAPIAYFL